MNHHLTDPDIIATIEDALRNERDSCAFTVKGDWCQQCAWDAARMVTRETHRCAGNPAPPAEWVALTGPCEHTHTTAPFYGGGNYGHYGTRRCLDCGATRDDYTPFHGEHRKRVTFARPCPQWNLHWVAKCDLCGEEGTIGGTVPLVSAAVTVQANDDGQTYTVGLDGMVAP